MKGIFPYKYKIAGFILVICATFLAAIHFIYGFKINLNVFAIHFPEVKNKLFELQQTNFAEEIILITFIAGFTLIVFSKEREELKILRTVRIKALCKTMVVYTIWISLVILFLFGKNFHFALVLNLLLTYIIYLAFFYHIKAKELKKRRLRKIQKKILNSLS